MNYNVLEKKSVQIENEEKQICQRDKNSRTSNENHITCLARE